MEVGQFKITEKFIKTGRWYARTEEPIKGYRVVPFANLVWLEGNPAFKEIPTGYAIHHLDHDELNDDISNLVLMQKYHHVSHHLKQKKVFTVVKVDPNRGGRRASFFPTGDVKIKEYRPGKFRLRFYEKVDGKSVRTDLKSFDGMAITSVDQAEAIIKRAFCRG